MTIKNVYILQPKKGRRVKLFPLSFSTVRAIPRLVAPQQSQSPFHSTKQKYELSTFMETKLLTIKLRM